MIKLSVIIPFYNEKFYEVKSNLFMLDSQLNVDWNDVEVLLVNDGNSNYDINTMMTSIPYEWNFNYRFVYMDENGGPGMARQTGIDEAKGKYVMFIDADDCLHSSGVLSAFLAIINDENNDFDVISSKWLEEIKDENGNIVYINHEFDSTWMHGNAYKKSFLDYYNVRHHDELRVHEDSYFQMIAWARTDKIFYLDAITYVWKYREDSIVRRNNAEYSFSSNAQFFKAIRLGYEKVKKFNEERLTSGITQIMIYGYFTLMNPTYQKDEFKDYYKEAVNEYIQLIGQNIEYLIFDDSNPLFIQTYMQEANRFNIVPRYTVTDWLLLLKLIEIKNDEDEIDNEQTVIEEYDYVTVEDDQ